jgi:hypothetical protein
VLGKELELQTVTIVGGPAASIAEWTQNSLSRPQTSSPHDEDAAATPATSGISSAPPSPINPDLLSESFM